MEHRVSVVRGKREKKKSRGERLLPICWSPLLSNIHQGQLHKHMRNVSSHHTWASTRKTKALQQFDSWTCDTHVHAWIHSHLSEHSTNWHIHTFMQTNNTWLSHTYMHIPTHTCKHMPWPQQTWPLNHPIHPHTFCLPHHQYTSLSQIHTPSRTYLLTGKRH